MITVHARLLDAIGFLRFVLRRWSEDRCPQIAAGLTFTTLLALVPIFSIAVALLSQAPFFERMIVQFKVFLLLNLAPEIAGRIITVYMEQFRQNAAGLTGLGIAVLFVTALAMMFTVDRSINAIWRVRRPRPFWISVLAYVALLATGPLLIGVSVSTTTYLMAMSTGSGVPVAAHPFLLQAVPVTVSSVAFVLLYRIVPHRRVPWSHAIAGGVFAAVLFEAAKELFALYVAHVPAYSLVYGTFAAIPFFLLWVYLSWLVVLLGAELAASLDYWHHQAWKRIASRDTRFGDAVAIARRLFEARGESVGFEQLRGATGMPQDELEDALHHMAASGLVERVGRTGYAIPQPPGQAEELKPVGPAGEGDGDGAPRPRRRALR